MSKITQYSRISHHTLTTTGVPFTVPVSQDFTDGTWTPQDLALSEFGINEADKKVYIRIDDEVIELVTSSLTTNINVDNVNPLALSKFTIGNTSARKSFLFNTFTSNAVNNYTIVELPLSYISSKPGPTLVKINLTGYKTVGSTFEAYSNTITGLFTDSAMVGTLGFDARSNLTGGVNITISASFVAGSIRFILSQSAISLINWEASIEVNK